MSTRRPSRGVSRNAWALSIWNHHSASCSSKAMKKDSDLIRSNYGELQSAVLTLHGEVGFFLRGLEVFRLVAV